MRDFTMFWIGGFPAMQIEGDPSAGKTSLVEQTHARLNVPLYKIACTPLLENYKLIGQRLPNEDGKLVWHDGPVTRACREGTSVLLDEYNTLDPGEANGLNMLLEGKAWTIPETGEVIVPKPTTRFFCTQNAVDSNARVSGRNTQDVANEDRFFYMEVDYIRQEDEENIVVRTLEAGGVPTDQAATIATITVTVANHVRMAYRAQSEVIEKPLSTRVVLRWAALSYMYQSVFRSKGRSGIHYAATRAVKMPVAMATAVNDYITLVVGYDENLQAVSAPRSFP